MTLNRISRALHLTNRTVRDANAIRRGKVAQRVGNRVVGRLVSKAMRGAWLR